ncbi:MAG: FecR family protein [Bacteroidota bacterium]|nr:FecR family protein [Bacteroidota bacterium]
MDSQENINQEYKLLIYSYLSNQASEEEKSKLLNWLQESEENRKFYKSCQNLYDLTSVSQVSGKISGNKQGAWNQLKDKIETSDNAENAAKRWKITYRLLAVASVMLFFSLGTIATLLLSKGGPNRQLSEVVHEIIVPKGGKSELVLPDGTHVWLNAGSRLRYKGNYGFTNRNVYLEGEGYFSVVKNPQKPFVVDAFGVKIKALGTSFNVKAYPEEREVTTTLVEGKVKIEGKGVNIMLKPKQVVVLTKEAQDCPKGNLPDDENTTQTQGLGRGSDLAVNNGVKVDSDVNTNIYTSWKDNIWIINSESLENISQILERKFNVTVQIESPRLNQYRFTGRFNKETLEQILNVIELTAPIKYEINKGVVSIKEERKRSANYQDIIK